MKEARFMGAGNQNTRQEKIYVYNKETFQYFRTNNTLDIVHSR